MRDRDFQVPFETQLLQRPALARLPVEARVDFTALLAGAGRRGLVDLSSIVVETHRGPVPAQFSPADDFDAAERCRGTLLFLLPAREERFRATLRFTATDDLAAPRLPYPPRSYRRILPDGRAAPAPTSAECSLFRRATVVWTWKTTAASSPPTATGRTSRSRTSTR